MNWIKKISIGAAAACVLTAPVWVSAATVTDSGGSLDNGTASYTATISNDQGEAIRPVITLAWYENGTLQKLAQDTADGDIAPGSSAALSVSMDGINKTDNTRVVGFVWEDRSETVPVGYKEIERLGSSDTRITSITADGMDASAFAVDPESGRIEMRIPLYDSEGEAFDAAATRTLTVNVARADATVKVGDLILDGEGTQKTGQLALTEIKSLTVTAADGTQAGYAVDTWMGLQESFDEDSRVSGTYKGVNGKASFEGDFAVKGSEAKKIITASMNPQTNRDYHEFLTIGVRPIEEARQSGKTEAIGTAQSWASGGALNIAKTANDGTGNGTSSARVEFKVPGIAAADEMVLEYDVAYDFNVGEDEDYNRPDPYVTGMELTTDNGTTNRARYRVHGAYPGVDRSTHPPEECYIQFGKADSSKYSRNSKDKNLEVWHHIRVEGEKNSDSVGSYHIWIDGELQEDPLDMGNADNGIGWSTGVIRFTGSTSRCMSFWVDNVAISYRSSQGEAPEIDDQDQIPEGSGAGLSFNGAITPAGEVTVSGIGNAGVVTAELVRDYADGSQARAKETVLADAAVTRDGSFNFQWQLPESEAQKTEAERHYTLVVGNTNQRTGEEDRKIALYYATQAEIDSSLEAVAKAGSTASLGELLTRYAEVLQITGFLADSDYTENQEQVLSGLLLEMSAQPPKDNEDLSKYIRQAMGAAVIRAASPAEFDQAVFKYKDVLGLDTTEYDKDPALKAEMAARAGSVLRGEGQNPPSQMAEDFLKVQAVAAMNLAGRSDVCNVIDKYTEVFGRSSQGLTDAVKRAINAAMCVTGEADKYTSVAAVQKAWDDAKAQAEKNNSTGGGSTGGSTGGTTSNRSTTGSVGVPAVEADMLPQADTEMPVLFDDLDQAAWASDYINRLAAAGIVGGKAERLFAPNDPVTREEFAKMIALTMELPESSAELNFNDVDANGWYVPYIRQVLEAGFVRGYDDGTFGVGSPITREEAAALIARAAEYADCDVTPAEELTFEDTADISEFAVEAVKLCCGAEIVQGNELNQFLPAASITRAESAKMICCLLNLL